MNKKRVLLLVLVLIAALPLMMWLAWLLTPKTRLVIAIIDKTVMTPKGQKHISLDWILNNNRYTKTTKRNYTVNEDYFGFFPMTDEKYRIKGLERFSGPQLNQLSVDADMVYVASTYGIDKNEWFSSKNHAERSGMLYGGMSGNDVALAANMKARHKLVIAEFNSIASPTAENVRRQFEHIFAMRWSGWTARYFDSFDTSKNKELPGWLTLNYKRDHDNKWPFRKGGIALVSDSGHVVVLEDSTHLTKSVPDIVSSDYGQKKLGLPAKMKYPFWFDIIIPNLAVNQAVSSFDIGMNAAGAAELKKNGIPLTFPAILMHKGADYQFYYFSGNFCDNPISITTSYFKGVEAFKWLFYDSDKTIERSGFFWEFYRPLMTRILKDYVAEKKAK